MKRAALLFLAAGCADASRPPPYNTEVEPPAGLERAARIVRAQWASRLGVDLPDELPAIHYFTGCLQYPRDAMRQEWYSGCIEGRYWSADDSVDVRMRPTIAGDALAHELLHWSLENGLGDSNSEHNLPIWSQVRSVQDVLAVDALCGAKYDTATCDDIATRNDGLF